MASLAALPHRSAPNLVWLAVLAAGATLSQLLAVPALASTNGFHIKGGPGNFGVNGGTIDQTSSSAISASSVLTGLGNSAGTAAFAVAAGPGITRASLTATYGTSSNAPFDPSVSAAATTDLLISGPAGTVPINTSINLHVDGTINVPTCDQSAGFSGCDITLFLTGPNGRFAEVSVSEGLRTGSNLPGLVVDTIPSGRHVHGELTVPIDVMSNAPFTVTLALALGGGGLGTGSYQGDFYTPGSQYQFSFSSAGVLFNSLPAGYTASGENVVNNHWSNPFTPPAADVVVTDCNDPLLASLTTVTGSLIIKNLPLCTQILLPNLISVGGDLIITGDTNASVINLGGLTTVTGSVTITDNGTSVVSLGSLDTVSGSVEISGNTNAVAIDVGGLTGVDGSVTITDNGTSAVSIGALTTVSASVEVTDLSGSDVFSVGAGLITSGSVDLTTDAGQVAGSTGLAGTDIVMPSGAATMEVQIPTGAFATPVSFTISRLAVDPPAAGTAADGTAANIAPLVSYQFAFAVPTLNLDASLSFSIDMTALSSADQASILNSIASGAASIIGKSDAPGATYTAFPLCIGVQTPAQNGCAAVSLLDASGQPTTGQPAFVRFDGVVGHFSSYGIGTITKQDVSPPVVVRNTAGDECSLPGDNGWCRGTQTAGFEVSDAGSSISTPCAASAGASCVFTRSTAVNGAAVTVASGAVCDVSNSCAPGITAGPFKIDSVAPTLAPKISPQSLLVGTSATASPNASDSTSGIAASSCPAVDTKTAGQHSLTCTARDKAGNTATVSVTYSVGNPAQCDQQRSHADNCKKDDHDDDRDHHGDHDDRRDHDDGHGHP